MPNLTPAQLAALFPGDPIRNRRTGMVHRVGDYRAEKSGAPTVLCSGAEVTPSGYEIPPPGWRLACRRCESMMQAHKDRAPLFAEVS